MEPEYHAGINIDGFVELIHACDVTLNGVIENEIRGGGMHTISPESLQKVDNLGKTISEAKEVIQPGALATKAKMEVIVPRLIAARKELLDSL